MTPDRVPVAANEPEYEERVHRLVQNVRHGFEKCSCAYMGEGQVFECWSCIGRRSLDTLSGLARGVSS